MPLVYQHNINDTTKLAVWHIAEADTFFLEWVPLKKDVSHPHKRLQHLAGRYLLPLLFNDFPLQEILIADTRKPFLEKEQYHFSISHCGDYAAAIVSKNERVGIDIEKVTPKIERVQHKFINDIEMRWLSEGMKDFSEQGLFAGNINQQLLTTIWSAKESIFKWYSHGQLDFKKHMQLNGPIIFTEGQGLSLPFSFSKDEIHQFIVHAKYFDGLVLAWIHSGDVK